MSPLLSADCSAEYLGQDWLVLVLLHSHLSCLFLPLLDCVLLFSKCFSEKVFHYTSVDRASTECTAQLCALPTIGRKSDCFDRTERGGGDWGTYSQAHSLPVTLVSRSHHVSCSR